MKAQHLPKPSTNSKLNVFEKRFQMMMKLYRIQAMLKRAKIVYPSSK